MYYNARWMDPSLGRFASADSIVPAGLQGYDRYAYANNNPVNFTDPSGHEPNWKLRHLKRDYGRYWDDVKGAWHREGDSALVKWSNRIEAERDAAEAAAAQQQTLEGLMWDLMNSPVAVLDGGFSTVPGAACSVPGSLSCSQGTMLPNYSSPQPPINWGQVAAGVGIILVVDLLIVAPLAVGIAGTPGAGEAFLLSSEAWLPIFGGGAIVAVNVMAWNMIIEGFTGEPVVAPASQVPVCRP